jgi:CHAD domain-containing protein
VQDQAAVDRFLDLLGTDSWTPATAVGHGRTAYFDSFDWRLYRRGWTLIRDHGKLRLLDRSTGRVLADLSVPAQAAPRFAWEIEPGALRDLLAGALKMRALVHLVTLQGPVRSWDYRDRGSDRVWRLEYRELELRRPRVGRVSLPVLALRRTDGGAGSGSGKLMKVAAKAGLQPVPPTLLEHALAGAGIAAARYSSRIRVPLESNQPAGEAAVVLALHLLRNMKANLAGVLRDIDTEFLHDLRVAIRRTRTLTALMKGVLPAEIRRDAGSRFARLGDLTGPLRDIDVFLLRCGDFRKMLPAALHPGLEEIFMLTASRRRLVRPEIEACLGRDDGQQQLLAWEAFLKRGAEAWDPRPPAADRPVGKVADRIISRRYAAIRRLMAGMGEDPADRDLHRLRIRCKKLRYAVEFFASLYSARKVSRVVGLLKGLQKHLGENNDLATQQAYLQELLATRGAAALSPGAAAAVGALVVRLTDRQTAVRARCLTACAEFASAESADLSERLVRSRR